MGSKDYNSGFKIAGTKSFGTVYYNLDAKYSSISGLVVNLDSYNYPTSFNVYGDDTLLSTLGVEGAALPKEFNINISGVRQLEIEATKDGASPAYIVDFANVVLK